MRRYFMVMMLSSLALPACGDTPAAGTTGAGAGAGEGTSARGEAEWSVGDGDRDEPGGRGVTDGGAGDAPGADEQRVRDPEGDDVTGPNADDPRAGAPGDEGDGDARPDQGGELGSSDPVPGTARDWAERWWTNAEGDFAGHAEMTVHIERDTFPQFNRYTAYAVFTDLPPAIAKKWTEVHSPMVGEGEAMHIVFEAPIIVDTQLTDLPAHLPLDEEVTYVVRDRRTGARACDEVAPHEGSWMEDEMMLNLYSWRGAQAQLETCSIGGFVTVRWNVSPEDGRPYAQMSFTSEFSDGTSVVDHRVRVPYDTIVHGF